VLLQRRSQLLERRSLPAMMRDLMGRW
jgi:hypothetical protein